MALQECFPHQFKQFLFATRYSAFGRISISLVFGGGSSLTKSGQGTYAVAEKSVIYTYIDTYTHVYTVYSIYVCPIILAPMELGNTAPGCALAQVLRLGSDVGHSAQMRIRVLPRQSWRVAAQQGQVKTLKTEEGDQKRTLSSRV